MGYKIQVIRAKNIVIFRVRYYLDYKNYLESRNVRTKYIITKAII
jgi:hypothetical protein